MTNTEELSKSTSPITAELSPPPSAPPAFFPTASSSDQSQIQYDHHHVMVHDQNSHPNPLTIKSQKLKLIPLIFLIYFGVSGGPYGEEQAVQAAGPLFALLGFLIFPFIWSAPEALITAELSTAYPRNASYVLWVSEAFGHYLGFLVGWCKWVSGVIGNASYSILCLDYAKRVFPALESGPYRTLSIVLFNVVLSVLNYTGLAVVGWLAFVLAIVTLLPFILMLFIAIPKIRAYRWLDQGQGDKDLGLYLNTLFWNLNYWDSTSSIAGEVDRPGKTYPAGLFFAILLTCVSYLVPLIAGLGALELNQSEWSDGYLAVVAGAIGGNWLMFWVEVGALLSTIGLFESGLSGSAYWLLGMVELGYLPNFMGHRSKKFRTPTFGVLLSAVVILGLSFMSFTDAVATSNFLYGCSVLIEIWAFLWLRYKKPELKRPFKIPGGMAAAIGLCLVPTAFLILLMVKAKKMIYAISGGVAFVFSLCYLLVELCKAKKWMVFSKKPLDYEIDDH